jgi:glycosyltransferase involved in cell wall biosynthesis
MLSSLDALKEQTLQKNRWELLIIDNLSDVKISSYVDVSWHPNAYIVEEQMLGLAHARRCGMQVARGDVLCFVDDDNVLDCNYLEATLEISQQNVWLGAWGGNSTGVFEKPLPAWAESLKGMLAIRQIEVARWVNYNCSCMATMPFGAGLCLRRRVTDYYLSLIEREPHRLALGRVGKALTSGEDSDIVEAAIDLGLGYGVFPQLSLKHLIPMERVEPQYLERLLSGMSESCVFRDFMRGTAQHYRSSLLTLRIIDAILTWNWQSRKIKIARLIGMIRGKKKAKQFLRIHQSTTFQK